MDDDNGDTPAVTAAEPATRSRVDQIAPPLGATDGKRLGDELPVFCERCGYSLHGLPLVRCGTCRVLHAACPECDHHQPINTLRPAFQRMLGRLRSFALTFLVVLKINAVFWPLFGWGALGSGITYTYAQQRGGGTYYYRHQDIEVEGCIIIFTFAAGFGMVARMLLLRWRRGVYVGITLGALVALAMYAGAYLQYLDYMNSSSGVTAPRPEGETLFTYMLCGFAGAVAGAACVWGIWLSLVRVFLPTRAADSLIEWQRAMSAPPGAPDRTDATTSVTA